jgi:hypothetical protein
MEDKDKKPFDVESLEVSELEDENLEGVTGGGVEGAGDSTDNPTPIVINTAPGCGVKQ